MHIRPSESGFAQTNCGRTGWLNAGQPQRILSPRRRAGPSGFSKAGRVWSFSATGGGHCTAPVAGGKILIRSVLGVLPVWRPRVPAPGPPKTWTDIFDVMTSVHSRRFICTCRCQALDSHTWTQRLSGRLSVRWAPWPPQEWRRGLLISRGPRLSRRTWQPRHWPPSSAIVDMRN